MIRFIVVGLVVLRTVECLGGTLSRSPAFTFLSARSGWRIYEASDLSVNPNLSIAPTSVSPNANQREVLVDFGDGQDPQTGLATVGVFVGSNMNRRNGIYPNKGYDLDSVVITFNNTGNQTAVPATPISLAFLPTHGTSNQCLVARINMQASNNMNGVITNINVIGGPGASCAIFVRNSTDTSLLDARNIRKCGLGLLKCSRPLQKLRR